MEPANTQSKKNVLRNPYIDESPNTSQDIKFPEIKGAYSKGYNLNEHSKMSNRLGRGYEEGGGYLVLTK